MRKAETSLKHILFIKVSLLVNYSWPTKGEMLSVSRDTGDLMIGHVSNSIIS